MSHRCCEPGELAALVALPADDPRRLEAAGCPRCDSLLRAMDTFLEGDRSIPADEMTRAQLAMAATVAAQAARVADRRGHRQVRRAAGSRGDRRALPRWGWGLGLAAAVALVVVLGAPGVLRPTGPSGVLRGGAGPRVLDLAVSWAPADGAGQVRLAWPEVPGAVRYDVELYSAALDTLGAYTTAGGPSVLVDAADFGPNGPAGVLCRIRAVGTAGPVGSSRLAPLPAR